MVTLEQITRMQKDHKAILRALAAHPNGLTAAELTKLTGVCRIPARVCELRLDHHHKIKTTYIPPTESRFGRLALYTYAPN